MSARLRVPRQIKAGAVAAVAPGARLRCVVLAAGSEEWVGVDLASGAFVRNPAGGPVPDPRGLRPLQVLDLIVGGVDETFDPTRPEAVVLSEASAPIGELKGRKARRLLRCLAAPERRGTPLLGWWGPSVAFEDLDGTTPSLVLVELANGALEIASEPAEVPRCVLRWAGVRQALPVVDPALASAPSRGPGRHTRLAELLGFVPGFALVGLGAVRSGYVPKVLLSLLPS
jgi:hypothetical protein